MSVCDGRSSGGSVPLLWGERLNLLSACTFQLIL